MSTRSKQSLPIGKRIDWEDINIKAGIAFSIATLAIVIIAYLLVKGT